MNSTLEYINYQYLVRISSVNQNLAGPDSMICASLQPCQEGGGLRKFSQAPQRLGAPPSCQKYFCCMFDSKSDHLNWAYISRQLLCVVFFLTRMVSRVPLWLSMGLLVWVVISLQNAFHELAVIFMTSVFINSLYCTECRQHKVTISTFVSRTVVDCEVVS